MKIGVLAPESSWHFHDLHRASKLLADVKVSSVDFKGLAASVGLNTNELFFQHSQSLGDLNGLIVRTMPFGSLQQVVFRMDLLHRISAIGIQVVNPPRSVEIAIDKYLSLCLMSEAGIAVPPFAVCQTVAQGLEFFDQLGGDVILKPIFGSMGKRVFRFTDRDDLAIEMGRFVESGEVLYLQRFIHHDGTDIRIFVVGEKTYSMRRRCADGEWLTNVSQGAVAEEYVATPTEIQIAKQAATANQCDVAGVDLVYGKESAHPLVLEVNASPGWEAIQAVTGQDIAVEILKLICV